MKSEAIRDYHKKHRCCEYCKNCYIQLYSMVGVHVFSSHKCAVKGMTVRDKMPRWFCKYFEPTDHNDGPPMKRRTIPPMPKREGRAAD